MALEITATATLSVFKPAIMASSTGLALVNQLFTMTGTQFIGPQSLSVLTSATVIPLGGITTPHWFFAINLDPTNYITLRNGSSGANVVKLLGGQPGEFCMFPWDDAATPYAIANTATCQMEYCLFAK